MKISLEELSEDELGLLVSEAEIMKSIEHPHLVKCVDAF